MSRPLLLGAVAYDARAVDHGTVTIWAGFPDRPRDRRLNLVAS
jgi:hypothetical protein